MRGDDRFTQLLLTLFCALAPLCRSIPIDNEILGSLNVTCLDTSINVNFKTRNPFNGRVYVKGSFADPQCSADFTANADDQGVMVLPFSDCPMERTRMSDNRGVKHTTTVIVSFHPIFITKVDRAFKIQCLYENLDYLLTQGLQVSMLPTVAQDHQEPSPNCSYTLHKDTKDGPLIKYANVGDTVIHKWRCETDKHAILVHSCFVKGAGRGMVELVSEIGCGLDAHIVGNLTYEGGLTEAWTETHAFKFQEVDDLSFSCKIHLCSKSDTECLRDTPPNCSAAQRSRRSLDSSSVSVKTNSMRVVDMEDNNATFVTDTNEHAAFFLASQKAARTAEPTQHSLFTRRSGVGECRQGLTAAVLSVSVLTTCLVSSVAAFVLSRYYWHHSVNTARLNASQQRYLVFKNGI